MTGFKEPPTVEIDTKEADRFIGQANSVVQLPITESHSALSQLDRARLALEKAASIDVVKEIRDQAEVLRIYAKQAKQSFDMQNHCAEIKIRAERKAGQMLLDQDKNKGAATPPDQERDIPRLSEMGITHAQSSRWQSIAGIPEDVFEEHLDRLKEGYKEITSAGFLRLAQKCGKPEKKDDQPNREVKTMIRDFGRAVNTMRRAIECFEIGMWRNVSRKSVAERIRELLDLVETGITPAEENSDG